MGRLLASVPDDELALRYRVVHGYRRAYGHAGRGPALLFIHGIGDSSVTWLEVLPSLVTDFTVIAPDLLGHGESDKPRADYSAAAYANGMRDLLTLLDVDRVTIIGHSLGGGVAAQFAYQFPHLVERLVLVGAGGAGGASTRSCGWPHTRVWTWYCRWSPRDWCVDSSGRCDGRSARWVA